MATRKISRRMKEKAQSKKGAPKMHARAPGNKSKLHVHPSIRRSCHPSFHSFIHEYVRSCMHHLRHSCIYKKHDLCRKMGADLKRMFARAAGAGNRIREIRAARSGAASMLRTPTPRCLPPHRAVYPPPLCLHTPTLPRPYPAYPALGPMTERVRPVSPSLRRAAKGATCNAADRTVFWRNFGVAMGSHGRLPKERGS